MLLNKPPTLQAIMNSIVNFGVSEENQKKINELAKYARTTIFDFDYPLTSNISKEDFEVNILNHFIMRRIGFDTVNAFKIFLNNKLNEIMPLYNKLFDSIDGWNLFNDGYSETRNRTNTLKGDTQSYNVDDNRYSDTPQSNLDNIREAKYVTGYGYNQNNSNATTNTKGVENETITKTPADKIKIYKEFLESKQNIYTMIYNDLDSLFYGLL